MDVDLDPWDIPVKPKVRQASKKTPRPQEAFSKKLKNNICPSETQLPTHTTQKISTLKLQKVMKHFQLTPTDDYIDTQTDGPSFSDALKPFSHVEKTVTFVEPMQRKPSTIMPMGSCDTNMTMSISDTHPSVPKKRGSFLHRSEEFRMSEEENFPPVRNDPEPEALTNDTVIEHISPYKGKNSQMEGVSKYPSPSDPTPNSSPKLHNPPGASVTSSTGNSSRFPVSSAPSRSYRTSVGPTKNYLKINLRKKCFSRKGSTRQRMLQRKVKFEKYKRKYAGQGTNCFRCGQSGHWAKKCPISVMEKKPEVNVNTDANYASKLASSLWRILDVCELDKRFGGAQFEDVFQNISPTNMNSFEDCSFEEMSKACRSHLEVFGFSSFRPGQELVILRVLMGVSSLAVLPTAAGKSLCYQLPAVIFQYAFLMVSPEALVDSDWLLQPGRLPPISFVCVDEAHCLADWSHHFRPSYLRVCSLLRNCLGIKCFLGLSATCTQTTLTNVCRNLGILNATRLTGDEITPQTVQQPGFIQPVPSPIPSHLCITASTDIDRDDGLLRLLTRSPFSQLTGGILIYVATRDLTERLASYIRTALQEVEDKIGRRRLKWTSAAYHAGLTTAERARIQQRFMNGKVRVLVATSAFGMGLNKADLQAVIHYTLTKSFENYVQEIGRVGRSQQFSYCHTFVPRALTTDPEEANEIRRHIFGNHIDPSMLKRLLQRIFKGLVCTCRPTDQCTGHVHSIDGNVVGEACDIKTESLATLLAYMELEPEDPLISILQPGYATATVDCYGGPAELAHASQRCLAVAGGLGLEASRTEREVITSSRQLTLNLTELCNRWGWRSNKVRQELKALEWDTVSRGTTEAQTSDTPSTSVHRTGIQVNLSQWSWWIWVHAPKASIAPERLDRCLQYLHRRLCIVEQTALDSVNRLTQALASIARQSVDEVYPLDDTEDETVASIRESNSTRMHQIVENHFVGDSDVDGKQQEESECSWPPSVKDGQIACVRSRVREFFSVHGNDLSDRLNGRTLANLFHGISTPQFAVQYWSRVRRFWRAHLDVDWPLIKRIATEELLQLIN